MSISGDGLNAGAGGSGDIRIFKYTSLTNTWNQVGGAIDIFGTSISLSANGDTVASGHANESGYIRVFRYSSETDAWIQLGTTIKGDHSNEYFGYSISLSADGNTVAAGSYNSNSGYIKIFRYSTEANELIQLNKT